MPKETFKESIDNFFKVQRDILEKTTQIPAPAQKDSWPDTYHKRVEKHSKEVKALLDDSYWTTAQAELQEATKDAPKIDAAGVKKVVDELKVHIAKIDEVQKNRGVFRRTVMTEFPVDDVEFAGRIQNSIQTNVRDQIFGLVGRDYRRHQMRVSVENRLKEKKEAFDRNVRDNIGTALMVYVDDANAIGESIALDLYVSFSCFSCWNRHFLGQIFLAVFLSRLK